MGKWLNSEHIDLILTALSVVDERAVCSVQPSTYFEAIHPDLWTPETAYSPGDMVRPPDDNGFVYECTVGGTSGVGEPVWGVVQDATFADNTVTWKTHENYSLINDPLAPGDKIIENDPVDGRRMRIVQKVALTSHRSGTVSHVALIEHATKKLHLVTTASTVLEGHDDIVAGRSTLLYEMYISQRNIA